MFTATLRLPATMAALAELYPWLEKAAEDAGVPAKIMTRLHVAAEEAATNAVRHGGAAEIVLTLVSGDGLVSLVLEDQGSEFDPLNASLPEHEHSLDAITPGGWGLNLIRKFCPQPRYQRVGEVNRLTLAYPIS